MKPYYFGSRGRGYLGGHKLGATGQYSQGKLSHDDEGELKMAVAADQEDQVVRIEFGKTIAWLALPRREAIELADLIKKHAEKLVSDK